MVKHAADETAPLLTAEERVERGRSRRSTEGRSLTDGAGAVARAASAQHLVENLSIDRTTSTTCPSSPDTAAGAGPTRCSTGSSTSLLTNSMRRCGGMTDVVGRLWGFCHTLRHDGIDYGDYIEQITYLLFLKMADERGIIELAESTKTDWPHLREPAAAPTLTEHYTEALRDARASSRASSATSSRARSRASPTRSTSRSSSSSIDETEWTSLDVDVKAAAFEGLLEKAASRGQEGRRPVLHAAPPHPVDGPLHEARSACDTATSRSGSRLRHRRIPRRGLRMAHGRDQGGAIDREHRQAGPAARPTTGRNSSPRPRRLALMNLYLHQRRAADHGSATRSTRHRPGQRFDVILTNPPFGTKGANQAPDRDDFTCRDSNKQLNFLQHVLTILKPGGRAAVVVPDNVPLRRPGR